MKPHKLLPLLPRPILSSSILKLIRLSFSKLYHLSSLLLPLPPLPSTSPFFSCLVFSLVVLALTAEQGSAAADHQIIPRHERMSSIFFFLFFFLQVVLTTAPLHILSHLFLFCLLTPLSPARPFIPSFLSPTPPFPKISPSLDPPLYLTLSSSLHFIILLPSSPHLPLQPVFLLSFPSRCWFLIVVDRLGFFLSPSSPLFLSISLITCRDKGV